MLKRMLPTLAFLGLGLTLLLWGMGSLQRIVMDERAEAVSQVVAERNALEEYARRTVEQRLESALPEAEFKWARDDPLMPTQHLLFIERGQQVFPRTVRFTNRASREATQIYLDLRANRIPRDLPPSPWSERVSTIDQLHAALLERDRDLIELHVRSILDHYLHWVIDSHNDIPARLAMVELLIEFADVNPELIESLLRSGLFVDDRLVVEGLQPALVRHRDRFSQFEFQFLAGRVVALSERTQTRVDDFRARVAEPVTVPLPPLPATLTEPSVLLNGSWYARPAGPDRVVGIAIDFDELLGQVETEMHARALLDADDRLVRPDLSRPIVALSNLAIAVESARFAQAVEAGERRYRVKTGFVALSAFLALVIVVLALVVQGRRQRFVELKSDFVATVSHELRTPLASIRLMAETLERRAKRIPAARDYPTRIVREIDDLSFLVENILSFNRLDKGRWKPRRSNVDVAEIVDQIQQDAPAFAPRSVQWTLSELEGVVLHVDRELLKLLLRNLAKNACAYNDREPICIEMRGYTTKRFWKLDVSDNGVGLSPLEARRIFAEFYRAHSSSSHGSGLGLAIARKIMRAHGGQITVARSTSAGSTFTLSFPLHLLRTPDDDTSEIVGR